MSVSWMGSCSHCPRYIVFVHRFLGLQAKVKLMLIIIFLPWCMIMSFCADWEQCRLEETCTASFISWLFSVFLLCVQLYHNMLPILLHKASWQRSLLLHSHCVPNCVSPVPNYTWTAPASHAYDIFQLRLGTFTVTDDKNVWQLTSK